MEEKYMVNDIINDFKNLVKIYTDAIVEVENIDIRSEMQSQRNAYENFQYNLYKISEAKGYYNFGLKVQKLQLDKIKENLKIE